MSIEVNLVLQSFGRENEYKRAIFTILSFYAFSSLPVEKTRVILFTDQPNYFQYFLQSLPVQYILLTKEKILQMRGKIDFLHRMKIALIEEAFSISEGAIIYADSDSFFIADPVPMVKELSPAKSCMHVWEYELESLKNAALPAGQTALAFYELILSRTFQLADGSEVKYPLNSSSWNAGIMMFHADHSKFIPDVYALTDQFYPPTLNHASEQYAFSLVLKHRTEIMPCDSVIYHYWYRVKKQIIDSFLAGRITANWGQQSMSKKVKQVKDWCLILPGYLEKHILTVKDNAIQSFNKRHFRKGYSYALKALLRKPLDFHFLKDVLYHSKNWKKA
jgi:hypothetical protein